MRFLYLLFKLLFLLPTVCLAGHLHAQVTENNTLTLTAPAGRIFTSVDYANYGTATDNGDGTYTTGTCHGVNSSQIVESYALNQNTFSIPANNQTFGDPCYGILKTLSVVVTYSEPLPVELVSFTATMALATRMAKLAWTTAAELHASHFEVQRSTTGTLFAAIGTVGATGNSNFSHTYGFIDTTLPLGTATLYYRLRQVDADSTSTYSPVRTLTLATALAPAISLYPNPTVLGTTLDLQQLPAGSYQVRVLNPLGQAIQAYSLAAGQTYDLPLATLPSGAYWVLVLGITVQGHAIRLAQQLLKE